MKNILKIYIIKFLSLINFLFPKSNKKVLFLSYPDLTDNSFAFFKYMVENSSIKFQYIWLIQEPKNIAVYKKMIEENIVMEEDDIEKINFIQKNSIKGYLAYLSTKYIFFTHGFYIGVSIPSQQILINLWHGMPLKAIAYLDDKKTKNQVAKSTYTIATSFVFKKLMSEAFAIPESHVLLSGQPRCDLLFDQKTCLKRLGIQKEKYNKIIFWAPTYRRSYTDDINDGTFKDGFPLIDLEHLADFNQHLYKIGSFMLIKLHPMDILNQKQFPQLSNIKIIKNTDLLETACQLYSLLAEIDILMTDYSSIYIDFLITEKPIIFVTEDFTSYSKTRGFVFDDPKKYMPGVVVNDYKELKDLLSALIIDNKDNFVEIRKKINEEFNEIKSDFSKNLFQKLKLASIL